MSRGDPAISVTFLRRQSTLFWMLQIGVWVAFGGAMSLGRIGEWPLAWIVAFEWPFAALGFLTTLLLGVLYGRLRLGRAPLARTIGASLLGSYLGALVWTAAYRTYERTLTESLITRWTGEPVSLRPAPFLDNTVFHAFVLLAWSALYFGIEYYGALQAERERVLRAEARAKEAQLQMLAYQLNPHFLFNALNSLRAIIDEDRARARWMVTELAVFLRYALEERPLQIARLSEELAVIRGYLDIELIRFEEHLDIGFDVDPVAAERIIPAFLLHPLVENALKHGAPLGPGEPLRLRIDGRVVGDRLRVVVSNTGTLSPPGTASSRPSLAGSHSTPVGTGAGLSNVRERLQQLFPEGHSFALEERDGWIMATVEIPEIASESDPRLPLTNAAGGARELRLVGERA